MKHRYTIIILLATTEKWLKMSRTERNAFNRHFFEPLLLKYKDSVSVKLFDSESMHAKHTDFITISTNDLS